MIIRLLFILRRRWPVALLLPLVGASLGLLLTPTGKAKEAPRFQATAVVAVDPNVVGQTQVKQLLIESRQGLVAETAAKDLGEGVTASDVGAVIAASFDEVSYTITIKGTSGSDDVAENYTRSFVDAFLVVNNGTAELAAAQKLQEAEDAANEAQERLDQFLQENALAINSGSVPPTVQIDLQNLQNQVQTTRQTLTDLQNEPKSEDRYREISFSGAGGISSNRLELPASRLLRVSLGLILGVVAAAIVIGIVEKLNPRIDDPLHAEEIIGAPVIAMVPVMNRRRAKAISRASLDSFRGPFAEAFRSTRSHLEFRAQADGFEKPPRILVTSATPNEGKSTSAAFMAVAFAEAERPPVVIGADLRRPSIHNIFDITRVPGLSSRATAGGTSIPLAEIVKTDPETGVSVVPSGPAVDRVTGLLGDLTLITTAGQEAGRVVIIDTPPVMVANDATDFLSAADWVVVVVRIGRSTERSVKQMMSTLRLNAATVVGVIMVGSVESADAKRYYYSYYAPDDRDRSRRVVAVQESELPVDVLRTTGDLDGGS